MSGFADYEQHDAVGLAALVKSGETTPEALLAAAIERVESRDPGLGALVMRWFDQARAAISAGLPDGPFRGVPFLLKDLYAACEGEELTNGSCLYRGSVSEADIELVARYRRAGLVFFGRSASPEFGITTTTESVLYGQTRNPWNPEHTAGGSSGGAGAAVAAGILPAAHASDGGGSIRIPASCNGLFGLKPTRARNPSGPLVGEGWSGMSTAHVVSRSVRDSAALLDVTEGPDLGTPYWAPPPARPYIEEVGADPGRLRIGVQTTTFNGAPTHADCETAAREAAALCRELGHEVKEATLSVDAERFGRASQIIIAANLRASVDEHTAARGRELAEDELEPLTRFMYSAAANATAAEYAGAVRTIHAIGRDVARFLQPIDVLLTPTMATPPLPLGVLALTNSDVPELMAALQQTVGFTQLFNASGNPSMSVPLHWNGVGLPVGVQFTGRFGDEATLLRLAAQLEQAKPWWERRPPGL